MLSSLIYFIADNGPVLGQFVIIIALTATACFAVNELNKMPRTFWFIFRNRLRYLNVSRKTYGFWNMVRILNPFNRYTGEYSPYNDSYKWLMSNKLYIQYAVFLSVTIVMIYSQVHQFGTGFVFLKPKETFYISPIRSVTIIYIFMSLAEEVKRFKKENTILRLKLLNMDKGLVK